MWPYCIEDRKLITGHGHGYGHGHGHSHGHGHGYGYSHSHGYSHGHGYGHGHGHGHWSFPANELNNHPQVYCKHKTDDNKWKLKVIVFDDNVLNLDNIYYRSLNNSEW